jgi:hypothetical protein
MAAKPKAKRTDPLAGAVVLAGCVMAALALIGLIAKAMGPAAAAGAGLPDWPAVVQVLLWLGAILGIAAGAALGVLARRAA